MRAYATHNRGYNYILTIIDTFKQVRVDRAGENEKRARRDRGVRDHVTTKR